MAFQGICEPPEELDLVHQQQDAHDDGGVEQHERETVWQIIALDRWGDDDHQQVDVVQVVEKTVLADGPEPLEIANHVENQQRCRCRGDEGEHLLRNAREGIVVGTVQHIATVRIKPEDEWQRDEGDRGVQGVILPPSVTDDSLLVIIAQQKERIEIEGALDG